MSTPEISPNFIHTHLTTAKHYHQNVSQVPEMYMSKMKVSVDLFFSCDL